MRNKLKVISLFLFACFIASVYLHTKYFIESTFPYSDYEGNISYYIKGDEYTTVAKKFKEAHPYIESDEYLIQEGFGSPDKKGLVWTDTSIKKNLLKLISSYSLLIISFVSLISLLLEVLISRYNKSSTKTIETDALSAPKAKA